MSDKAPREKIQVEPSSSDPEFAAWYETLFEGAQSFPEKIEVRIVTGRNGERMGPIIKQFQFLPVPKDKKKDSESAGSSERVYGRPSREDIVKTTNEILFLCQRDCNQSNRPVKYAVLVAHFARNDDYYERWLMTLQPKVKGGGKPHPVGEEDEDDYDGESMGKRFSTQILHHRERMDNLYALTMEGLLDRMDRVLEREHRANDSLRAQTERQSDIIERLQSNRHEREMQLEWNKLKMQTVEKGMNLAIGMAPTIINQLSGKQIVQTTETPESITLKEFFKTEQEGGKMTLAQSDAAFGRYAEGKVVTQGVLTEAQTTVLYEVAQCVKPAEALDTLLPGGSNEVTMEQIMGLQQIFSSNMDQIVPVMALINQRMHNKKNG